MKYKITKTNDEWKKQLSPEQFKICREKYTERPFTGIYNDCKEKGTYNCLCCDAKLFSSNAKFNSGSGWPDFHSAIKKENLKFKDDYSSGEKQIEVKCNTCDSHLGHIFEDGPTPHHTRY